MAYALCLLGLIGDISFKIDDVFAINNNSCIIFITLEKPLGKTSVVINKIS